MSTYLDDNDLDAIYNLTLRSSEVKNLIDEKNNTINNISKQSNTSFEKPSPAPKPSKDIRIFDKDKGKSLDKETSDKLINKTQNEYDKKIKEDVIETAKRTNQDDYVIDQIQEMNAEDVSYLAENGPEKFREYENLKEQSKNDLPTQLDEKSTQEIWGENKEDISKSDVEPNISKQTSIQMDSQVMDEMMDDNKYRFEFEKEEKQPDKNKEEEKPPPEPSDDYE